MNIVWTSRPASAAATANPPVALIVDDEAEDRDIEAHALKQAGFAVLPVGSSTSALQLAEARMPIDLVVADLHMSGMDGDELAMRLRRIRPGLKILFVTPFPDHVIDTDGLVWSDEAYLHKPFTDAGLIEAVALLLCGRITH